MARLLIIVVFAFLSSPVSTSTPKKPLDWTSVFRPIVKKKGLELRQFYLGLSKITPETKSWLFQGDTSAIPASLSKLFTAASALKHLGPATTFKTRLISEKSPGAGKLLGDLYLVGGGDPSFVSESMWKLVNDFTRSGVKRIEGDIVVDDSLFDSVRYSETRSKKRVERAYDAPVSAMSFNWNSVNVYIRPGLSVGAPLRVMLDPEAEYFDLENKTQTSPFGSKSKLQVERSPFKRDKTGSRAVVRVKGTMPVGAKEKVVYRSITHPSIWSGYHLKAFLQRRGISVSGQVRRQKAPSGATVLAEVESKPVSMIVSDLMKFSNNYVAEMLTKHLSMVRSKVPGDLQGGLAVIRKDMGECGFDPANESFSNPSGLTRDNRVRTRTLLCLLKKEVGVFERFPEFTASLPISGTDGTLKSRFVNNELRGALRAKTGLLSGVVGLAGYVRDAQSQVWIFSFLFNGSDKDVWKARDTLDEFVSKVVQYKGGELQ